MPLNLEIKIRLDSFDEIKSLLKKIDADFVEVLNQKDIYYKISNGLLKLRIENGKQSLIKYLRDEKNTNRWSNFDLIKFSEGNAEEVLKGIFVEEAVVEKKRLLFMFDDTRIHLDEIKNLGKFLELETLVINGKADARKRFNKIIRLLNLNLENQIRKSYRDLIMEKEKNDSN